MSISPQEIRALEWVEALRPVGQPRLARLSKHSDFEAWHIDVEFTTWPISPDLAERWKENAHNNNETWRKRPLIVGADSGCRFSCGEVELTARLRRAGYNSRWVSEWSGYPYVECWRPYCVKRSDLESLEPEVWAADHDLRMRAGANGEKLGKRGGHPDVAAWHSQKDMVYVEYKGPGDSINAKQDLWAQEVVRQNSNRFCYLVAFGVIRTPAE